MDTVSFSNTKWHWDRGKTKIYSIKRMPRLLPPTAEQRAELLRIQNTADLDALLMFLQLNHEMSLDSIVNKTGNTILMEMMFHAGVGADDLVFDEVLRRKPDPFVKNKFGQTALNIAKQRFQQFKQGPKSEQFWEKVQAAKQYEKDYLRNIARNASTMKSLSKNGLYIGKPNDTRVQIPPDTENIVSGFLTGESGGPSVALSKLRVKAGLPGVPSQGGRKKTRKAKGRGRKTMKRRHV